MQITGRFLFESFTLKPPLTLSYLRKHVDAV